MTNKNNDGQFMRMEWNEDVGPDDDGDSIWVKRSGVVIGCVSGFLGLRLYVVVCRDDGKICKLPASVVNRGDK